MTSKNNILSKAYVLTSSNNTHSTANQLKSNQFISLLSTCNISIVKGTQLPDENEQANYSLFFVDFTGFKDGANIPDNILKLAVDSKVAVFNCQQELLCEKLALLAGIHGVFYSEDRADITLKGIENLLNDDRWFKRETMNLAIAELLNNPMLSQKSLPNSDTNKVVFPTLTKREKTIIDLVSSGAQNKEIADQLHISPNTVKTHIYSIFRKTSSRNRIELLSWTKQFQQLN